MEILSDNWNLFITFVLVLACVAVVLYTRRRDRQEAEDDGTDPMERFEEVAEAEKRVRLHPKA